MTVHDLHDALNDLPSDLLAAADKARTMPKVVIPWRRFAAMAAVLVLVIGTTMIFGREIYPYMSDAKMESAAQAPAAAAPMAPLPAEQEVTADEALPEPPSDIGVPEIPAGEASGSKSGMEEELCIDHSHNFAEKSDRTVNSSNYCGNMMTTVYLNGEEHTFAGGDSITITEILTNLDYNPDEVCRCMTEFAVDTELLTGIEVNLTEGFARCEQGQAGLTEEQVTILREIIENLK